MRTARLHALPVVAAALLAGVAAAPPSLAEDGVVAAFSGAYDAGDFTYHFAGQAIKAPPVNGISHVQGTCAATHDPGDVTGPDWGWTGVIQATCYARNDATGEAYPVDGLFTSGPEGSFWAGGYAKAVESEAMSYCATVTGPGLPAEGHTVCAPFLP